MVVVTDPRQFPVGCRFHPSEEEILSHYMEGRIRGVPGNNWMIPDVHICSCDPWDLSGIFNGKPIISWDDKVQEGWFFSRYRAKQAGESTRAERSTPSGFWKQTSGNVSVKARDTDTVIGIRKILVFHRGKGKKAEKTYWVIHEYHLPGDDLDTLVLCRLKLKRDKKADKSAKESKYLKELELYLDRFDNEDSADEDVLQAKMNSLRPLVGPVLPDDFMLIENVQMNRQAQTTHSVHGFVPVEEKKGVVEKKFIGSPFASEKPLPRPGATNIKEECISLDETAARAKVLGYEERGSAGNSTKKANSKEIEYAREKSNSVAASTGTTSESTKTSTNPPLANLVNVLIGIFLLLTITRQVLNF